MKLLAISNMYPEPRDPTYGTFVRIWVDSLDPEIKTTLVVIRGRKTFWKKVLAYGWFYIKILYHWYFAAPDLVYVHYILHPAPLLLFLQRLSPRKLILNYHGGDLMVRGKLHAALDFFARRLARRAHRIVVPSRYFAREASTRLRRDPSDIFVWPSGGFDARIFYPPTQVSWPPESLHLVCISRLDPMKGIAVLLEAVAAIAAEISLKVTIAGYGSPTEQSDLRASISQKRLQNIVEYAGALSHADCADLLRKAHAFVFPTLYPESLGLVGVEALACGVPVIGSATGALPEFITPGANGFLFSPGNAADLARCIRTLYELPPQQYAAYRQAATRSAQVFESSKIRSSLNDFLRANTSPT